jgi:hypothetical protein
LTSLFLIPQLEQRLGGGLLLWCTVQLAF